MKALRGKSCQFFIILEHATHFETCDTSKLERSELVEILIPENILDISVMLLVVKCDKSASQYLKAPLNILIVSTDDIEIS